MLTHPKPQEPKNGRKMAKNGKSTKHRKTRGFLMVRGGGGGSAAGGAAPLSYGEERNAFGYATARGPLAGFKGCRPCRRPRKKWQRSKPNGHKCASVLYRCSTRNKTQRHPSCAGIRCNWDCWCPKRRWINTMAGHAWPS